MINVLINFATNSKSIICFVMKKIKLLSIITFTFFIATSINSQIGIEFIGNSNTFNRWNDVIYEYSAKESKIFKYSYGGGVNYWFRLTHYRLEFTPGVYYLFSKFKFPESACKFEYFSQIAGIEFDINMYPFDFICRNFERDCPTFSNKGQWFRKNMFLQVSPSIYGSLRNVKNSPDILEEQYIAGKVDFGVGIDVKVFNSLVIAPIIKYGFYINEKWDGFSEFHAEESFNDPTAGSFVALVFCFYLK